jgi:hypothetical protein
MQGSDKKIPQNRLLGFCVILALPISIMIFSIYNLINNNSITLFTLTFWYAFFCFCGIIFFMVYTKNVTVFRSTPVKLTPQVEKIFQISFIFFYIISVGILLDTHYTKPLFFYILIAFMFILLLFQILFINFNNNNTKFAVVFILLFLFASVLRFSSAVINPYLIGPDTLWHFHNIQQVIETGFINPAFGQYFYFPSYYLVQLDLGQLFAFSENTFNFINILISILSLLVTYLIGKEVFEDIKAGLLAVLFVSVSTMALHCVVFNTSKIIGILLFLLCLYFLIQTLKKTDVRYKILFCITFIPLFLSHPDTSIGLVAFIGAILVYEILFKTRLYSHFFNALLVFIIGIYSYYFLVFNEELAGVIVHFLSSAPRETLVSVYPQVGSQEVGADWTKQLFFIEASFAYLGITLLVFFIVLFVLVSFLNSNKQLVIVSLAIVLLHIIPLLAVLFGKSFIAGRFITETPIILSLFCVGMILCLFKQQTVLKLVLVGCIFFLFAFFSSSSYLIGDGNDIANDEIFIQTMYTTTSNLQSFNFLNQTPSDSSIFIDSNSAMNMWSLSRGYYDLHGRSMSQTIDSSDFIFLNKPNLKRQNWKNSEQGALFNSNEKFYNKLYSNGEISIFSPGYLQ